VITHDLEKLAAHADRLVIMDAGRIEVDDAPSRAVELAPRFGLKPPRGPLEEMSWLK
jgi:biotin transport system ATP-binding protein